MSACEYRGTDARGLGRHGAFHGSVSEFVEKRYHARWRTLTVTRDGERVAEIGRPGDNRRRTWWSVTA